MLMWMAYAAGVAGLLAAGGLVLERVFASWGQPRRFPWLAALTVAVVIPLAATAPENATAGGGAGEPVAMAGEGGGPVEAGTAAVGNGTGALGRDSDAARASRAALLVWGLATLGILAALGAVLLVTARARRRWPRRFVGGEEVHVSRDFGPALVGLARPAVVIPRWVLKLGPTVAATAVGHEREHARAGDHLALLYAGLIAAAMPWSPAIWWMCRRLRTAVEIDCDRRVIGSGIPAIEYGSLLLGVGAVRPHRRVFALTMAGSRTQLERRLHAMMNVDAGNGRKRMKWSSAALLAGLVPATVAVACEVPPPTAIAPAVTAALGDDVRADGMAEDDDRDDSRGGTGRARASREGGGIEIGDDGRMLIRGVNRMPSLSLTPSDVAANPLVLVDDAPLEGGLAALLAGEPLDIRGIGYSEHGDGFGDLGVERGRGIVRIKTVKGATGSEVEWTVPGRAATERGREAMARADAAMARGTEALDRWAEFLAKAQEAWDRRKEEWERRKEGLRRKYPVDGVRVGTTMTAPRDPDAAERAGWVIVRDVNGEGSLWLSPASVAANPPVAIDGVALEGGLRALRKLGPMRMVRFGYLGPERGIFISTKP